MNWQSVIANPHQSLKKRQEWRDDLLANVVQHPLQYGMDRPVFDGELRPLSEGNAEGRAASHIHFRISMEGWIIPRDYCVLFN